MTQIVQGGNIVTLINVFSVAPENQQKIMELLVNAYMFSAQVPRG